MSGSRRSVPSPEHGASTSTQSNRAEKGRRCRGIGLNDADARRAGALHGLGQQPDAPRPDVGGDNQPLVSHGGGHRRRLAARGRARVEDPLAGADAGHQRDELRRLVLHDERAARGERGEQRDCRSSTTSPSGAKRRRAGHDAVPSESSASRSGVVRSRLARSVSAAGVLLKRHHAPPRRSRTGPASAPRATAGATSVVER